MQKLVNITYTTISPYHIFSFSYQHQVIEIMRLQMVWIIPSDWFTQVNELLNTSHKTPLPKTKCLCYGVKFVMPTLKYIIVLGEANRSKKMMYYR